MDSHLNLWPLHFVALLSVVCVCRVHVLRCAVCESYLYSCDGTLHRHLDWTFEWHCVIVVQHLHLMGTVAGVCVRACVYSGELLHFNAKLLSMHHSNFNYIIQIGSHWNTQTNNDRNSERSECINSPASSHAYTQCNNNICSSFVAMKRSGAWLHVHHLWIKKANRNVHCTTTAKPNQVENFSGSFTSR